MTGALGLVVVAAGMALLALSGVLRARGRQKALVEALDLPRAAPATSQDRAPETPRPVVEGAVDLAGRAVERLDRRGALGAALQRARVPLRPGEFVIVSGATGLALAALVSGLTGQVVLGLAAVGATPVGSSFFVRRRINKRRKQFEEQLPGALSLVASSLAAGHTFLRAVQMMCEESEPPLSEEFRRVVTDTQLGDAVVDAMGHMAERLAIRDVDWVVQAIRIQQTVGGKLAELLHTLADFMRAREDVRREVLVLTAEGRVSAYVLGAMPPFLLLAIQVMNPGYLKPMLQGWGPVVLALAGVSVAVGTTVILRMAKIEV